MDNFIYAYYQQIVDGTEIVGIWVRLFYEKVVAGIDDGTYRFDQSKANKAIKFIEKFCRHNKGKLAPGFLKLDLWEKAFISALYGIVDENGKRQFREVALFVGRKCGKTLIAAAILTYEAYLDGEFGSEIYCLAPKLDQSDLVYSAFEFNVMHSPDLMKRIKKRKNDWFIQSKNTTIKKIAFNEKKADGYNPMATICDECSSWPAARGLKQYEVMTSGTGAREEPLTISISSGGYVDGGIYDELFTRGTRFLLGEGHEQRLLPLFYMIDDIEKWDDINELRKSLPGMGRSVPVQFILDQIAIAHDSLSKKAEFICKFCNLKSNSSQAWLSADTVKKMCGAHFEMEDFKSHYCVAGIDLSQTTDLTSACLLIEKDGELYVISHFWLPSEKLSEAIAQDGIPYNLYIEKGWLTLSGENYIDYKGVYEWLVRAVQEYELLPLVVGYDRYSSQYLVQDLDGFGFKTDDVYQGDNLWGVLQEMEGIFKDGHVHIGDNDLLKIHLLNSAIKMSTERGRGRLIKLRQRDHIDGVAALADAFCVRQKYFSELSERLKNKE
jgi:phage terminase large subunit-like protein